MAITADFHLHTEHSTDSDEPMENMILKAIDLGLTNICFTEHHDPDFPYDEHNPEGSFQLNLDSYLYDLLILRDKYKDKIKVTLGVELGMQPHLGPLLDRYAASCDFDFIIGSVHIMDRKDPYFRDDFKDLTDEELYRRYFEEVLKDINAFSKFDTLGHLDYIVRYGYEKDKDYSYDKYKDVIDPILIKLTDMGRALELNTGAIRNNMKELNPCMDILKRYRKLGGELITVGSDAHDASHIADGFDRAEKVLLDCGFTHYATFERRMPIFHKLG